MSLITQGSSYGGFGGASPVTPPRRRRASLSGQRAGEGEAEMMPVDRDLSGRMIRKAPVPTQQDLKNWTDSRGESPRRRSRMSPARTRDTGNVRVFVRVRPFTEAEVADAAANEEPLQSVVKVPNPQKCLLLDHTQGYREKAMFDFDDVFWSNHHEAAGVPLDTQQEVYEASGKICLDNAWDGFNSCIFAYGQTGSGKTHTMMGPPVEMAKGGCTDDEYGVIPRLGKELFRQREERLNAAQLAGVTKHFDVIVTFFEIYNERVYDLVRESNTNSGARGTESNADSSDTRMGSRSRLKAEGQLSHPSTPSADPLHEPGLRRGLSSRGMRRVDTLGADAESTDDCETPVAANKEDYLRIREHPLYGPYVDGLTTYHPSSYEELITLIHKGTRMRHWAATKLNDRSSRSHAIFRITVQQTTILNNNERGGYGQRTVSSERRANVNLVDLAGSENIKRSGAAGTTLVEAQKINLSLTTLRRVIDSLIDKKQSVVPYRDSTLTWLLSQDLGGNSKTIMLATVSGHPSNGYESLRTLEYAMKAKSIVNKVRQNDQDETARLIAEIEKRYAEMQRRLVESREQGANTASAGSADAQAAAGPDPHVEQKQREAEELAAQAEREAEDLKRELEEFKERSIKQAYRSACQLNDTRARLKRNEDEKKEVAESVSVLERQLDARQELVNKLHREKDDLEQREAEMKVREEELLAALTREHEEKLVREKELHSVEQVREENTVLSGKIAELGEKMSAILHDHRFESEKLKRHHELHVTALAAEKDEAINRHKATLVELQNDYDNYRMETYSIRRELEETNAYERRCREDEIEAMQRKMKVLEDRYKDSQDALEVERVKNKEIVSYFQRDIGHFQEVMKAYHRETDDLQSELKTSNADYLDQLKLMSNLRFRIAEILRKEAAYEAVYEDVSAILEKLQASQGVLPEYMTFDDVKRLILEFYAMKRAYGSNRPNKELLRNMLRTDPSRRGAERMRQLLDCEGGAANSTGPPRGGAHRNAALGDALKGEPLEVPIVMDSVKRCPDVSIPSPPPPIREAVIFRGPLSESPQRGAGISFAPRGASPPHAATASPPLSNVIAAPKSPSSRSKPIVIGGDAKKSLGAKTGSMRKRTAPTATAARGADLGSAAAKKRPGSGFSPQGGPSQAPTIPRPGSAAAAKRSTPRGALVFD